MARMHSTPQRPSIGATTEKSKPAPPRSGFVFISKDRAVAEIGCANRKEPDRSKVVAKVIH
eukprot:6498667-Pyramimonas_sp.AAC.2